MSTPAAGEPDYFTDRSVLKDPYAYFESIRTRGPVARLQARDLVMVTGHAEAIEVLLNTRDFSSVVSTGGPAQPMPFEPQGDDIDAQLEAHRHQFIGADLLVAYDGERHAATRSLLTRLFVPSRMRANELYMQELADRLARETVARGRCELIFDVASAYVTLVIADLLGVPAEDREHFRTMLSQGPPAGNMDTSDTRPAGSSLDYMAGYFARYIQERRAVPRQDVMTELATATYPDGTLPELMEIVKLAMFLFAAGQDTSAKLLGNAMRYLADNPEMQRRLRSEPALVGAFVEEMLRLEGSTKATFRIARHRTRIGAMEIPAGTRVVVALAAANRDARRWPGPAAFRLDRDKPREHLGFGRGAHTCIGAPLARVEVRVLLEAFLRHAGDITLSAEHHGPAGQRRFEYEPSYIIRGLERLHLEFRPN